ncbi:hypothetical protein ACFXPY_32780 [Streptomyces sp. NPDC059153]|uniref:hypothetical protein n=1 Tax=Streptomyces sp. NPDC059153 TaxID=3346743 RepID=UPI00368B424D
MAVVRLHLASPFRPVEAQAVLTDFGPSPAENRPTIGAGRFTVHQLGEDWAEGTEGTRRRVRSGRATSGTRKPSSLKGKILAPLLPLVAPSSLRKSFAGPLKAAA